MRSRKEKRKLLKQTARDLKVDTPLQREVANLQREVLRLKHNEEVLRRANETFQALIQASPLAIIDLDSEGKIKMLNSAAESIFGWEREEMLELPFLFNHKHKDRQDESL